MGGKQKQSQRTKNNARPSNSGRSAELLGTSSTQYVSFSGAKETGYSLPIFSLTSVEDFDSSVDTNFQLVLKKMNKKDATTKLKALHEYALLVKEADPEAVKAILPFWPRLYSALATDADHRVREAVHVAHQQVVLKAKRNIAPYLKQLAGPWFTSQYDTYAPAASAATLSFQDAFPANKLLEAIIFCQEEILNYIYDNLIVHSAQTFSNPKSTTPEDLEAKYERVLISSLQGYSLYLNKVPTDFIHKAEELNKRIVSSSKFWKFSKHKGALIRSAWFGVLTVICQRAPFLLENEAAHVVTAVYGNLDESDPVVLPTVWEAALLTVTTIAEWWQYISIEKLLLPKLFKVLKEGGQGNAAVIYPNLLPLISHLPPTLDTYTFYPNYFDNMKIGLKQKSVISSRSESNAVSISIIECLQYVILKNQSNTLLCEKLIRGQLISLIEWCLIEGQSTYKICFNQIASLIQYWNRNRNTDDVPNYKKYLDIFWSCLDSLFQGLFMKFEYNFESNSVTDLASKQIEFLMSLKHTVKLKRQLKVKFMVENVPEGGDTVDSKKSNTNYDQCYLDALNELVYKTCECYVKFVSDKQCKELIEHIFSLMQDFNSEPFFMYLNQKLGGSSDLIYIYDSLLLKWIKSSYLCSKSVVDLVFLLLRYLNNDGKIKILDSLAQVTRDDCLGWCIARGLSYPHNGDEAVQNWLSNDKIGTFVVKIVEKEISDDCTPDLSLLLKQAFTENKNGDLFISKTSVMQVLEKLSKCLLCPGDFSLTIDTCASLAAYVSAIIYTDTLVLKYSDQLLLALFTLSCNNKIDHETLSQDTQWEVFTAWQDVISTISSELDQTQLNALTEKFAAILENHLLFNTYNDIVVEDMVDKILCYVRAMKGNHPFLVGETLNIFFNHRCLNHWTMQLTTVCKEAEYLNGALTWPYENFSADDCTIEDVNIAKYFIWKRIILAVISSPISENNDGSDNEDCESERSLVLKITDNPENLIISLFYDLSIAESLINNYKTMKYINLIENEFKSMKSKLITLFDTLDDNSKCKLNKTVIGNVYSDHWLWAKMAYMYYSEICKSSTKEAYKMIITHTKKTGEKDDIGRIHLTQAFARDLSYDDIESRLTDLESIVTLRCLMHCEDIDVQIGGVYGRIEKLRNLEIERYFYDINFSNREQTQTIIEVILLCCKLIALEKMEISRRHWDFIVVSLASWAAKLPSIKDDNIQITLFISAIAQLFSAVDLQIKRLEIENPSCNFIDEWNNVFVQSITTDIIRMWMFLAEKYEKLQQNIAISKLPFLQEFGKVIKHINCKYIFEARIDTMPKWSKLLKQCCLLINSSVHCLQLWGYHLLIVMTPGLIEVDSVAVNTNTPHEKGMVFEQFKNLLVQTHEIVQSMLLDFKLGEDSCRVEPYTDSYTYTFAYILLWDILLSLCEKSSTELKYQYSDWLRKEDLLNNFLSSIFKLMPAEVVHYAEGKSKPCYDHFMNKTDLSLEESISSEKIERMVCWVYASTLSQLPASVRQWWTGVETRTSQIVERVTSAYVSPHLCVQELQDVAEHETKFKNMVVKVHPGFREVVAIYTVDEAQMELVITLPVNYPLGGPDVHCNRQIGGTSHKQWIMQLKMCVLHQNGRIWDGLSLWNNNLDKKFDGVEECYICFAVLHPGTYQLPKLSCKTCRKKFHAACLYKWFSTSNKSTCPICRNLF